jgi:hypothetical protein
MGSLARKKHPRLTASKAPLTTSLAASDKGVFPAPALATSRLQPLLIYSNILKNVGIFFKTSNPRID